MMLSVLYLHTAAACGRKARNRLEVAGCRDFNQDSWASSGKADGHVRWVEKTTGLEDVRELLGKPNGQNRNDLLCD